MQLDRVACIQDLIPLARKRIPRFAFDFLDSGAGDDSGVHRNRQAVERTVLKPRYLTGTTGERLETRVTLFGRTYKQPFGLAPTGLNNIIWPGADMMLAALAAQAEVPIVISTNATSSMEDMARAAPRVSWFQLYARTDPEMNRDLLARARAAGVEVLVVTVDIPGPPNRNRDFRNQFGGVPFKLSPGFVVDALRHPGWALAQARGGPLSFENLAPYAGKGTGNQTLMNIVRSNKGDLTWDDLKVLRDQWEGPLVVKGILAVEDAQQAVELGADGVWVSNHGGRQLESAPAAMDSLRQIAAAVGGRTKVLMDGGIRSGEDVVKAKALGADMVFIGRPLLYGIAAAGGAKGGARAMDLFRKDVLRTMVQIGCPDVQDLDRRWIWESRD